MDRHTDRQYEKYLPTCTGGNKTCTHGGGGCGHGGNEHRDTSGKTRNKSTSFPGFMA